MIAAATSHPVVAADSLAKRPFSVRDGIEMARITEPSGLDNRWGLAQSPDGKHFFFVTRQGVLATDTNRYSLNLIDPAAALKSQSAIARKYDRNSRTNDPAIVGARWLDNTHIVFGDFSAPNAPMLLSWNIMSGKARKLAALDPDTVRFDMTAKGTIAEIVAKRIYSPSEAATLSRTGFAVSPETLITLIGDSWKTSLSGKYDVMLIERTAGQQRRHMLVGGISGRFSLESTPDEQLSLSPDGNLVAIVQAPEAGSAAKASGQVVLYETAHPGKAGRSVALVGRCAERGLHWVSTSQLVVDCGIDAGPGEGPTETAKTISASPILVALNPVDVRRSRVLQEPLAADETIGRVAWLPQERLLAMDVLNEGAYRLPSRSLFLERSGGAWRASRRWTGLKPGAELVPGLGLAVYRHEDANTLPRIEIIDAVTGQLRVSTPIVPELTNVQLGDVSTLTVKDAKGGIWTFGVLRPPTFQDGVRYPVIIQTHGYDPTEFLVDGPQFPMQTGYAAQALAAVGFIVVQGLIPTIREVATPSEGNEAILATKAIVAELERREWIDPDRIGIQGFSRASYWIKYALVFGDVHFAAATIADGVDYGYGQAPYMLDKTGELNPGAKGIYSGAVPVGEGLKYWLQTAPAFNVDRVDTPVRIQALGAAGGIVSEAEFYAALKMRKRPVELVFFPDGAHRLVKPSELMNSQEGNVDWFRYWILHQVDPDPRKAEQYTRWERLKNDHDN